MHSVETDRLLLRPFKFDDLQSLHSVIGEDSDLTWSQKPLSIEGTANTLRKLIKHYERHDFGVLAIVFKDNGMLIGLNGLNAMKNSNDVELVAYTAKQYWRQGIAFEAGSGALTYGFTELQLSRIVANIRIQNTGAKEMVAKLGFRFTREDRLYGQDVACYELLSEEFKPGNTVKIVRPIQEQ